MVVFSFGVSIIIVDADVLVLGVVAGTIVLVVGM